MIESGRFEIDGDEDEPYEFTLAAERPSAQGEDGNGPETGTAGATGERVREDA